MVGLGYRGHGFRCQSDVARPHVRIRTRIRCRTCDVRQVGHFVSGISGNTIPNVWCSSLQLACVRGVPSDLWVFDLYFEYIKVGIRRCRECMLDLRKVYVYLTIRHEEETLARTVPL